MRLASMLRELGNLFFRDTGASGEMLCMQILLHQQLRLRDAAGWVVESRGGTVWITQEGDARDVLLHTGERFTIDRDGKTIVSGIGEAVLSVRPPAGGGGRRHFRLVPRGANARTVWLNALYPETGWNEPASLRRAGLL